MKNDMDKIICIQSYGGGSIYVATTREKWEELTRHTDTSDGHIVSGWQLDPIWMEEIIRGAHPSREHFRVVARSPWRGYFRELGIHYSIEAPAPDYFVVYSTMDRPTRTQ